MIYFFMKYIALWTLPFIIGLVVAIMLQKPVAFLTEKTKLPRTLWSIVLVLAVMFVIFGIIAVIIWQICREAEGFASWLTGLIPDMRQTFTDLTNWFASFSQNMPSGTNTALQDAPATVVESLMSGLADFVANFAEKIITQGSGLLITVIFSVVASCYITKDYHKITNFILKQLSDKKKRIVINTKQLFVTNILKMLRGYIIIMFITFLELFAGLAILKVNYAPLLAGIIAVLDILPVIGTGAVLIPWGIISLLMGKTVLGIGLLAMYLIILIIRNIIEPRIIGQQVGLPPIVTLIAMYVGLKTFGVIGMMLFPVVTIILVKLQELGIVKIWNRTGNILVDKKAKKAEKKNKKAQPAVETVASESSEE